MERRLKSLYWSRRRFYKVHTSKDLHREKETKNIASKATKSFYQNSAIDRGFVTIINQTK